MYTIIAVEGIDQIGKSTFIKFLKSKLVLLTSECIIEKPTIGINTLNKNNYPLRVVPGIMEIRNIGLFEELLFQVQSHIENNLPDKCVIRDRFNSSELAYGIELRKEQFNRCLDSSDGLKLYTEWNRWFEQSLMQTSCKVKQIFFILDDESVPNEDESVDSKRLISVNENFKNISKTCEFQKVVITLHKNPKTGLTNILDYLDSVIAFIHK